MTTAPLNKEALRAAGIPHPGHTEIFAALTHAQRACMFQYSSEVRCVFVTTHVPYSEVPGLLTQGRILDTLELDPAAAGMRVVIFGHTHEPLLREHDGVLYLNPGSAGPRRSGLPVTAARMILEGGQVRAEIVDLGV